MHLLQLVPFVILSGVALGQRNFGALTTTFTPPSTCTLTTAYPADPEYDNPSGAGIALAAVYSMVDNPATACFPSDFGFKGQTTDFFSPGRCPFGYTTGEQSTFKDETRALCCPTGFTKGEYFTPCEKTVDGELTAQALLTRTGTGLEFFLVSSTSTFTSTQRTLYATGIPIRWHPIDLPTSVLPTSSSTSPSSTTTSSLVSFTTASTGGPSSTTTSTPSPPQTDGLSIGAEVGSILGAIFGAAAVGVAVYYGWRMTR